MKTQFAHPLKHSRRRFLLALLSSPLLLYTYSYANSNSTPALTPGDSDSFIIIDGWVLLKQDLA